MLSTSSLMACSAASMTGCTVINQKCSERLWVVLTMGCWGRMSSGQDGLGISILSLEYLQNGTNLVSDLGVLVDLGLESLEDPRIDHSRA